jgi:hypothetical protein
MPAPPCLRAPPPCPPLGTAPQNQVRKEQGIPPLVALLEAWDIKVQRAGAGALRTLAFKNEDNKRQIVECGALPLLIQVCFRVCEKERGYVRTVCCNHLQQPRAAGRKDRLAARHRVAKVCRPPRPKRRVLSLRSPCSSALMAAALRPLCRAYLRPRCCGPRMWACTMRRSA